MPEATIKSWFSIRTQKKKAQALQELDDDAAAMLRSKLGVDAMREALVTEFGWSAEDAKALKKPAAMAKLLELRRRRVQEEMDPEDEPGEQDEDGLNLEFAGEVDEFSDMEGQTFVREGVEHSVLEVGVHDASVVAFFCATDKMSDGEVTREQCEHEAANTVRGWIDESLVE